MKTTPHPCGQRGMTLLEVVFVLLLFAIGVAILLPALTPRRNPRTAARIKCANNLKQIGLAYRVFASDHDDKFPFPVTNSLAFGNVSQAWLHFQAMSNECGSARILLCPADRERTANIMSDFGMGTMARAYSLSTKSNSAVSYFASLDADQTLPKTLLSGDRHLLTNSFNVDGRLLLTSSNLTAASWTTNQHHFAGNFVLSDGSAHQATSFALANQVRLQGIATNRLLLPLLP